MTVSTNATRQVNMNHCPVTMGLIYLGFRKCRVKMKKRQAQEE